jgi:hypothetical protein
MFTSCEMPGQNPIKQWKVQASASLIMNAIAAKISLHPFKERIDSFTTQGWNAHNERTISREIPWHPCFTIIPSKYSDLRFHYASSTLS